MKVQKSRTASARKPKKTETKKTKTTKRTATAKAASSTAKTAKATRAVAPKTAAAKKPSKPPARTTMPAVTTKRLGKAVKAQVVEQPKSVNYGFAKTESQALHQAFASIDKRFVQLAGESLTGTRLDVELGKLSRRLDEAGEKAQSLTVFLGELKDMAKSMGDKVVDLTEFAAMPMREKRMNMTEFNKEDDAAS